MHRLVDTQPLHIGILDAAPQTGGLARQLFRVKQGLEGDKFGATGGLGTADDLCQRDTVPGQYHGPGFDAAQPVDPLLQLALVDEIPHIEGKGLGHLSLYLEGPGFGFEVMGIAGRIGLVGTQLIEVVVTGGLLFRCQHQIGRALGRPAVERPGG